METNKIKSHCQVGDKVLVQMGEAAKKDKAAGFEYNGVGGTVIGPIDGTANPMNGFDVEFYKGDVSGILGEHLVYFCLRY